MNIPEGSKIIQPQKGFQYNFLSSPADIVIGGGKAGSGKSYALLMEAVRHINTVIGFGAVIFRRTMPQIANEGGLWDTSLIMYPIAGLKDKKTEYKRVAHNGNKIKFSHLEHENSKDAWQGSQIPLIGFDELTHFTESQFRYLVGRNRSTCGVRPYVRATCNPDPDSRVKNLIDWWIDPVTGYIIKERDGVLRYFIRSGNNIVWGNSVQEVVDLAPHIFSLPEFANQDPANLIMSLTFIEGDIYDNAELLRTNPNYLANLMAQDEQTRSQLLDGNWHLKVDDLSIGDYGAISDIFSNYFEEYEEDDNGQIKKDNEGNLRLKKPLRVITQDVARFGRDLMVSIAWIGWKAERIDIMTKSSTVDCYNVAETQRRQYNIGKSQVIIDQDGVGGGVMDQGKYTGFSAGWQTLPDPKAKKRDKNAKPENYQKLKTQCYYRLFDRHINPRMISINADNIWVDGVQTTKVTIGGKQYDVKDLIMKDLRAIKRKGIDKDGKLQINDKDDQKIILGGRSPDFGDAIMMREYADLIAQPELDLYFI